VGVGAVLLLVAGRLFGVFELSLLAAAAFALLVAGVVHVRLTRLRIDVTRELHPPRVHAGAPSRVELRVTNRAAGGTPLLTMRDPVGQGRSARVLLAPMRSGQTVRAAYQLPTERGACWRSDRSTSRSATPSAWPPCGRGRRASPG
jgi:uncharacterized protein (DUF58 family)